MSALGNSPNHLLASLSDADAEMLQPHLEPIQLETATVLHNPEQTVERAYFPFTGLISHVVGVAEGHFIESGMIGRNSLDGAGAVIGSTTALNLATVQVPVTGVAVKISTLKRLAAKSPSLNDCFVRHDQLACAKLQQLLACNAIHGLEQRLSRCLLHARDLLNSDTLPLTQEFLSLMLAVQRTSVTVVARSLQDAGLIAYRRGLIQIVDRGALEAAACECYEAINAHADRLTGWKPHSKSESNAPRH